MDSLTSLQRVLLLGNDGAAVTGGVSHPFLLPTGTVTFLLTEVEDSTSLWERDPSSAAVAIERHYAILADAIATHGGVRPVAQGEGDSVVGAFSRASDAITAAVQAQRSLAIEVWPKGTAVKVRMAIHTGEAQLRDDGNYFGQTIVRCARLRSCGQGGQVLISKTVADLVSDRLPEGVSIRDLGRHRLRELNRPEQVSQLVVNDLVSDFSPLASLDTFRHNLPSPLTPLIGREAELAELAVLLTTERVVTLTGSGGSGKTRLACELGARLVERFPGGVTWVELAPRTDAVGVVGAVAAALHVGQETGQTVSESVAMSLRGERAALVILDNTEHVLDPAAVLVSELISGVGNLSVLCTSREPIGIPGEVVWRVPSLSTPRFDSTMKFATETLNQYDAVRLFIDRAARARRGFAVTEANAPAIAQICSRLDGVPLAIELAAARVRTMPPERIATQLDDRFRLLSGGPRTLLPRQQTLQASVAWSEELLDESERAVFRRMGVFMGGFTGDAAQAVVTSFGDIDPYDVVEIIGRLVDKSLVMLDEQHDRFALLETIRSYAVQRLVETKEAVQARDAHANWFADWLKELNDRVNANDAQQFISLTGPLSQAIDGDLANCYAALEWVQTGSPVSLRLCAGLGYFWMMTQAWSDAIRYASPALVAGDQTSSEWLSAIVSTFSLLTDSRDIAHLNLVPLALQVATHNGDEMATLRLGGPLAMANMIVNGISDTVLQSFKVGRDLGRKLNDWLTLTNCTYIPASGCATFGRIVEAESILGEFTNHRTLLVQATCARFRGDFLLAADLTDNAAIFLSEIPATSGERLLLTLAAAKLALATGDTAVLDPHRYPDLVDHQSRNGQFGSTITTMRGIVKLVDGDLKGAKQELDREAPPFLAARSKRWLAQLELALGDVHAARTAATELLSQWSHLSAPALETTAHLVLAECDRENDLLVALTQAHAALRIAAEFELWVPAIDALEGIGAMLLGVGRSRDSARLLAAAQASRDRLTYRYRFAHRFAYVEAAQKTVRSEVGWVEGTALSLVDAIAFAQRMRGDRVRPTVGWESLTPTELLVAELVVSGKTNPQIADQLLMSRATVKTHLVHVYEKLSLRTRAELAVMASHRSLAATT